MSLQLRPHQEHGLENYVLDSLEDTMRKSSMDLAHSENRTCYLDDGWRVG